MKYILTLLFFSLTLLSNREIPSYSKQELTGEIDETTHHDFILASSKWSNKNLYLRKEVYYSFVEMAKSAEKDGVRLVIVSGTRNHHRQTEIWEEKWQRFSGSEHQKAEEILEYSSMPGTSRHHWGTDFDINSVEVSYFNTNEGKKVYNWMSKNAWKYGFFQPYTKLGLEREKGYKEEKWHWSYFPLSYRFLKAYNKMVSYPDIKGFKGSQYGNEFNVFENYVNSIHSPKKTDSFSY